MPQKRLDEVIGSVHHPRRTSGSLAMDIPSSWEWSATQILHNPWRKILVIGAVDRGKSTYCHFLSQRLLATGATVAIVDADVGQKDIGPPAAITLGYTQSNVALTQVQPAAWYFVGAVSPAGHLLPAVIGTRQLVDVARAARVIINTTGFVHGLGRVLKGYKIDAVQPDVIVAIARGHELSALLTPYRHHRILRITPSPHAMAKTPQHRQSNRERAFAAYFASAREVLLSWQQVRLQRSLLFTGTRVQHAAFLYAERTAEGLLAVAAHGTPYSPGVTVLPAGFEQYLLCGLANQRNHGLGLAILKHIDFAEESLTLLTPVPAERIRIIQWGDLYISPDGRELDRRVPRGL
jgi:polynucleotide 5'-hydroxyl-kinase GRC3/NOL9